MGTIELENNNMKPVCSILFAAISAMIIASCASQSAPQALDAFVDKAELNSELYSPEDWERSELQYEKLIEQYANSGKSYTEAEKQMAARAMGRYHALLIKNGIEQSAEFLRELGNILPSYFEGITDGLEDSKIDWDSIFDEEKIEESLDGLEQSLEKIFGNY